MQLVASIIAAAFLHRGACVLKNVPAEEFKLFGYFNQGTNGIPEGIPVLTVPAGELSGLLNTEWLSSEFLMLLRFILMTGNLTML